MTPDILTTLLNGLAASGPVGVFAAIVFFFLVSMHREMLRRDDKHAKELSSLIARAEQREDTRIGIDRQITMALTGLTVTIASRDR